MSSITPKEVEALATLARVGLSDEETLSIAKELGSILDYAAELDEADVSAVEPTSQVTGLKNVYRDDLAVRSVISREDLLANAPAVEAGAIKVKAVL